MSPTSLRSPERKTTALALAVTAVSLAVTFRLSSDWTGPKASPAVWLALAVGFGLSEVLVFHIEVRRQAATFSVTELPLIFGLLFAPVLPLVLCRLVGSLVVLTFRERQSPQKLLVNQAGFLAETTLAIVVFVALKGDGDVTRPMSWLVVLVALLVGESAQCGLVALSMHWHDAQVDFGQIALANLVTLTTNTAFAVLAGALLRSSPAAIVPLVAVGGVVLLAYRGYVGLKQRYSSLQQLFNFMQDASAARQADDVVKSILAASRRLMRAERAAIVLDTADGPVCTVLRSECEEPERRWLDLSDVNNILGSEQSRVVRALTKDLDQQVFLAAIGAKDAVVTVLTDQGQRIGILLVMDRDTEVSTFDEEDGRLLDTLAHHASVALENGRLIERLHEQASEREHEATHDSLTNLPNRSSFSRMLEAAMAAAAGGSGPAELRVVLLDLNHFKDVNDTLGHHHGDLLLGQVARQLRQHLPAEAVLARLGGDEFACYLPSARMESREVGRLIHRVFAEPFLLDGLAVEIGASVGIAMFPQDGAEPALLLQRADVAMYEAKSASTEGMSVYSPARDANSVRRLALVSDLRRAIDTEQLDLHFQPKAIALTGEIVGAEALIRWQHPAYGTVSPAEFVPLAERTGLIQPFTHFVIDRGLCTLQEWGRDEVPLGMSINLSMRNLWDASLPARVSRLLDRYHVNPTLVTFEVTETSMMSEPAKVLRTLRGLADLGVRLSIDDFGTGHSSLSYLQRLPVHEVKIDRSFITPLATTETARSIVRSVIHLVHSLGLTAVAEGVEDAPTWDLLAGLGCDQIQGYFLCRPLSAHALGTWMVQERLADRTAIVPAMP